MSHEDRVRDECLYQKVLEVFRSRYGGNPDVVVRAPGRVNLLGAHVDYNDGWVLPAAIDRAAWLAASVCEGDTVAVEALDMQEESSFSLSNLAPKEQTATVNWADYPRGVAWALQAAGFRLPAIRGVLASDVPIGAGVSSSAAIEVAFLLAWNLLGDLQLDRVQLARLGQKVENRFLGVSSGIMDQFACLNGSAGHLVLLDCRTLQHELIPLPPQAEILVADTGIRRELANSNYNERRRQCEDAVRRLRAFLPDIRALRDVGSADFERYAHRLPPVIRRRARHVVEECERVLQGASLLKQGHVKRFGQLIRRSHASSRDLYEVSILNLDVLAATAWRSEGCYGARLTGAGFGGCVAILTRAQALDRVAQAVEDAYRMEFGESPALFTTGAADGAAVLQDFG